MRHLEVTDRFHFLIFNFRSNKYKYKFFSKNHIHFRNHLLILSTIKETIKLFMIKIKL